MRLLTKQRSEAKPMWTIGSNDIWVVDVFGGYAVRGKRVLVCRASLDGSHDRSLHLPLLPM